MALAGHPRAMKMAIFTPGPPRPGATSGHENRAGQQRQRQLFSDEQSVTHYANAARLHVRRTSERRRACVVSYANDQRGWSDLQNLDSLRVLFADAHRNPPLARRAQVLSERQRAINRSVLRLLAYPEPRCRQRLTTWKKNRRCAPGEGARSKPVTHYGFHSLALAQTLRSARRTEHFAGGPPGPIPQNVE